MLAACSGVAVAQRHGCISSVLACLACVLASHLLWLLPGCLASLLPDFRAMILSVSPPGSDDFGGSGYAFPSSLLAPSAPSAATAFAEPQLQLHQVREDAKRLNFSGASTLNFATDAIPVFEGFTAEGVYECCWPTARGRSANCCHKLCCVLCCAVSYPCRLLSDLQHWDGLMRALHH